ncbi:MAG: glycosyltransferase family 4 protein [Azospirillaceae bacterium]
MRIAFYAPMKSPRHAVPSGDRRVARLLMRALRRAGHTVALASELRAWEGAGDAGRQRAIARRGAARARDLVAGWRGGAWPAPDLWFTYHLYHKAPDWLGPPVSSALGIPYVVAEASHSPRRAEGAWAAGFRAAEAALRQADALIALTARDAAGLTAALGPEAPIHRLPPFLDERPYAAPDRAAARRRWGTADGGPWLLAVGMMRPGDKAASARVLADALARLAGRDWRLLVAGFGPLADTIPGWFPAGRVRTVGRLAGTDLPSLYRAADIFVWPAVNEAFGMAILEAQAAGLPVVAGRQGGVAEIVAEGETALLARAGDAADFADQLARLLDDPGLAARLGAAALHHVHQSHGMEAATVRLDRILATATRRHAR